MRLLIFILILPLTIFGQDINKVSNVTLKYKIGHYNFGDTGHYEKEEVIEFIPVSKSKFIRSYYLIIKKYVENPETRQNNRSISDTIFNEQNKNIDASILQKLIENCNRSENNFNKPNILPYLTRVTKKQILTTVKKYRKEYFLIDDETGRIDELGRKYIRDIKHYKFLDTFLMQRTPSVDNELVLIDAWNNLTITFIETSDTTKFTFLFYRFLGQPYDKILNNKFSNSVSYVNSNANLMLSRVLPKKSFARKAASFDSIKEDYILWYITGKLKDK